MLSSLILSAEAPAVGVFLLLLPNAGQSNPLYGGTGCGHFLLLLPNAGQSDPLGGGAGCGRFVLPRQELHACEMWISYLNASVDYLVLGEAHLRYLFLRHNPHLLVFRTCRSHCFHGDTTCVHFFLRRRQLLMGLSPSGIRDRIFSTTSLSRGKPTIMQGFDLGPNLPRR